MNYIDGGFVFEDLYKLARERRGEKVTMTWIPVPGEESLEFPPRVRECVVSYRAGLPTHLESHGIDACAIMEFRTEVYVAQNFRMYIRAYVLDNKGNEHIAFVMPK
ncbi:MAG: hypothetical protein V4631_15205 [Pseudomonadota bacterium]